MATSKGIKDEGISIRKISRQLKLSKNTVRNYLLTSEPPCFKAWHYNRLLDQYEESIKEMLDNRYIGTRIYDEPRQIGYEDSLPTVHRNIAKVRKDEQIKSKTTTRIEIAPANKCNITGTSGILQQVVK